MRRGKVLVKVLACLFLLPVSASFVLAHPTAKVEKTGQTTSYATGDDGYYEKGVAWPNPRFTDNGDGKVTDNLTGLMWTKNAVLFTSRNWSNAITACESLELGACDCNTCDDYRLPNRKELASLIDLSNYTPALPSGHPFTNFPDDWYWSSTTETSNSSYAWYVSIYDGSMGRQLKSSYNFVWCVRGGNN